jgi:hypothetical protein
MTSTSRAGAVDSRWRTFLGDWLADSAPGRSEAAKQGSGDTRAAVREEMSLRTQPYPEEGDRTGPADYGAMPHQPESNGLRPSSR